MFQNLAKFLMYLLSGNIAEIIVLLIGLAFKDQNGISTFPMSPVSGGSSPVIYIGRNCLTPPLMTTYSDVDQYLVRRSACFGARS